jgi:hypothetical protein
MQRKQAPNYLVIVTDTMIPLKNNGQELRSSPRRHFHTRSEMYIVFSFLFDNFNIKQPKVYYNWMFFLAVVTAKYPSCNFCRVSDTARPDLAQ